LGYGTILKIVNSFKIDTCATIYMNPETQSLGEVLLTNYITKGIGKSANGSFLIDYENFGILPGLIETDVLQTIQALPGIQSADETVSNLNIRGGTNDQNLILWDGIKMYQSGHFFGLISALNPSITKTATLIKNGTNPEYTDGVSGTILMNTSTEINDDFKINLGTNMINVDVFSDIPINKKSSLQVAARRSIRDLIKTPTYSKYFERISQNTEVENQRELNSDIGFNFYDVNLRLNYNISEKDQLRVNFLGISNDLVFTESTTANENMLLKQGSLKQNSIAGGIWYQKTWSDQFKTSLQIYETDYTLEANNANLEQEQRLLQENKVSETGIKLNVHYDWTKHISILGGYQFIETGVSNLNDIDFPRVREKRNRVIRTHSLYSQLSYKPSKKTFLNAGVRYNFNEKFNTHIIEPRISYTQRFLKYFNLEILTEFKHQNTTQVVNNPQNDFLGIEKRRWFLANNEDITVVKSKQISVGVGYSKQGWLISTEGYFKKVNNITSRSQGFENQFNPPVAIGDYTVQGLDVLLNKRFKALSTWLSYSLVNNQYLFEDYLDRQFPNNVDIRHTVGLGTSYGLNDFKIAAGLNWHSGLPTTRLIPGAAIIDAEIPYQEENSDRLDQYFRFDVSATYNFKISDKIKAQTGISVWNITNRRNTLNTYFNLNQENEPLEVVEFSLGITPNASFRLLF